MRILMVSSEADPFARTGGLGDVAGALPKELAAAGHEVVLAMPYYRDVAARGLKIEKVGIQLSVPEGDSVKTGELLRGCIPGTNVTVWFMDCPELYDRDGLYGTRVGDHPDNAARFVFLCRSVLEAAGAVDFAPEVIHCHDWQTALICAYRDTLYAHDPHVGDAATLLTIHSVQYQGIFWHWDMKLTGLDWSLFNLHQLEFYGKLNFLKGGIAFADLINTVSKRYAREIQTAEHGCGLEGILKERGGSLRGVLNGADYSVWNPSSDKLISAEYSAENLAGKSVCRRALQEEMGLETADRPMVGMVSRLADVKGMDLVTSGFASMMSLGFQLVILGTGDARYCEMLSDLAHRFPRQAAVRIAFDNGLAHRIQAGSDMFLMPSRSEPCGLTNLYASKYGTVPIVHETGGLADTVTDCTPEKLASGEATGFVFKEHSREAMLEAIRRALQLYGDRPNWERLMRSGMSQDWSWKKSAVEYEDLYREAVRRRRGVSS